MFFISYHFCGWDDIPPSLHEVYLVGEYIFANELLTFHVLYKYI